MKIKVMVHANSKSPRTEVTKNDVLNIYVKEPATEGKANRAVIEKLSEEYKVPKSSITLIYGEKSKTKIFEID
jgi:uncharacterized protein